MSSVEGHQNGQGLGALVLQREAKIAGLVQHEENIALEEPNMSYPTLTGR